MKSVRYLIIAFAWVPIIALAAWWAGFMPFPTRPEEVGWKSQTIDGINGSLKDYHLLISANKARQMAKDSPYGLGQWYCDKDNENLCHIYEVLEEPFFGWLTPRWVLTV